MVSRRIAAAGSLLVPLIAVSVILWPVPSPLAAPIDFSFETDMEGWAAASADQSWGNCTGSDEGNCTASWSIERTTDAAHEGSVSVRVILERGVVWIERAFEATADRTYSVDVGFAYASDSASVVHWAVFAGALPTRPISAADLPPSCRSDAVCPLDALSGVAWTEKRYTSTVHSGVDGHVWVVMGFRGTGEGPQTYYVDAVRVSLRLE